MPANREIPDNRLINDTYNKDPFPLWLWFFVVVAVGAVFWGTGSKWVQQREVEITSKPFLQVSNRDFSLFLWQFPEYMRANYPRKSGYLGAFSEDGIQLNPVEADDWVQAPPEVLFLYHAWDRLLKGSYFSREIPKKEFMQFLEDTQIWLPVNWKQAPVSYKTFASSLPTLQATDLSQSSKSELPMNVRLAFQGWQNFYKNGDEVNSVHPTFAEMETFLRSAPAYSRNYWRNIVMDERPDYLKAVESSAPEEKIPEDQLDGFLKYGFYNFNSSSQQ